MKALLWLRRMLTSGLTMIAFWNSYHHTAAWFTDHGQAAQADWLALIPEVGVISVVLTICYGKLGKVEQWIVGAIGAGSVMITFTANLSGASAGIAGVVAALVAPVFAVLGFALEAVALHAEIAPEKPKKPRAGTGKPRAKTKLSLTDVGVAWAKEQPVWPTTADVMKQFPAISRTTARKISSSNNRPVPAAV